MRRVSDDDHVATVESQQLFQPVHLFRLHQQHMDVLFPNSL